MARVPEDTVARIKRDIPLVRLVEQKGFTLKPHGRDYAIHCPFHEGDRTPSLIITPDVNLFHCPACGAKGSPIDWVMKIEGVSTRHALALLSAELEGTPALAAEPSAPARPVRQSTRQKLPPLLDTSADHQAALAQVLDYYHETLKQSPEALAYLEKRGIRNTELINTFKLGYANRTLAYRLPDSKRQAGAEMRGRLKEIGLLREKTGHEHFNGCLVVPVFDEQGRAVEVYGRKIRDDLRPGTAYHLYLPGPHAGVWNAAGLHGQHEVILCEALIDAMTVWCAGFRNVTAAYGTGGVTDELVQALVNSGAQRVLIAFDRDAAGNRAAEALAERLAGEGLDVFRVLLPKGMDVNEYALTMTPAAKSLELAFRKAEWMVNGKGKSATPEKHTDAANEKSPSEPTPALAAEPLAAQAATPAPSAVPAVDLPATEPDTEVRDHEILLTLGPRQVRVRGLDKNLSYEQLKVNLLIRAGERFHVDTFDLYAARARQSYIREAARELGVDEAALKADLGRVLLKLEALQEAHIQDTLAPKAAAPVMTDDELREARALLQDPALLERILDDFHRAGVVGEDTNKLMGYLAACSRKLDRPLAVMVQSSSAAGKSSLMDAVLAFMPEEERIQYSAMTGQALYYLGEQDLKHKILAIAEEEGAQNTSYALKLLQSEGEVSIASTGKNATTGNLETQEYRVEGPVMLFSTTTAIDIDEELMNRCLVLSVDESRAQTQAIHAAQRRRRTLEGLKAQQDKARLIRRHQNAQRLLRPVAVMNPYADRLTFLDNQTRTRRDHDKYLSLIDTVALLHQYQREVKRAEWDGQRLEYIEVTLGDIATANRLAHEVLGRTLDELPPQTRKLLGQVHAMVTEACAREGLAQSDYRFSRKQVRDSCGWGNTQLKVHLGRLEDMEYLLIHGGGRGKSICYELLYQGEGQDDRPFLPGLIDVRQLGYDPQKSGEHANRSGPSRPQVGPGSGAGRDGENADKPRHGGPQRQETGPDPENALPGGERLNGRTVAFTPPTTPLSNPQGR